jgi:uncharacterized delta-60 repeat protein
MLGRTPIVAVLVTLVGIGTAVATPPANASTLVVQPDGKLVLAGRVWPEAGALARLNPDGSIDASFGEGGFSLDRRLPAFRALALEPDGEILGASVGGALARYLPGGAADPSFGAGGIGGTDEPGQAHFIWGDDGPSALLIQPGGAIVVAGNHDVGGGGRDAWVRRYDAVGRAVEPVGSIPQLTGPADSTDLLGLVEEPDGSLIGAGSTYTFEASELQTRPLLARFVPRSGSPYDPAFGGGVGLVRPSSAGFEYRAAFQAIADDGDGMVAAGEAGKTFMFARFHSDGTLDGGFGDGGLVAPPIVGPAAQAQYAYPRSWAEDVAVTGDGGVIAGGGTEQWGTWTPLQRDLAPRCVDCPQPMLVKLGSGGHLDPGFGNGGLLLLRRPDGAPLSGSVAEVTPLAGGRLLVNGYTPQRAAFIARLNPDGSYDPTFGAGGLVILEFPCSSDDQTQLRAAGCAPSAVLRLRAHLRRRRPSLSLRVGPNLPWAAVRKVTLSLPRGLRPARGSLRKTRVVAVGGSKPGRVRLFRARGNTGASLVFTHFGAAQELRVTMAAGSLRPLSRERRRARRMRFRVAVDFTHVAWSDTIGSQTVVRSVRVRPAGT